MVHIKTRHYNDGLNRPYSEATLHYVYKHPNGAYTMKDARKYISEHAQYGIRGYLFENLSKWGSTSWVTETDVESEFRYPDRGPCND